MKQAGISRRDLLRTMAAAGLAASVRASAAEGAGRPNIILIMADDLGYECIGANGSTSYKTPVLDKMASEGVRFEHCYSQPLCTPSRVQIMTGIYNVRNYVRFGLLDPGQTTFAHLFKKAGYATCVVGKWQLGGGFEGPGHFGFDEYCLWQLTRGRAHQGHDTRYSNPKLEVNGKTVDYGKGRFGPDVVSDFACDFIQRNKDKPFLVYYPMILTHCPFVPTPDSANWDPKDMGSKSYKGNAKYFGDMVTTMDKMVGKLLKKLEELGLRKNTLVLFTGDNGTDKPVVSMMGDTKIAGAKGAMTDGGTRVPLIVSRPGAAPKGKVCRDMIDFSDFLPTICECAGIPVPGKLSIDGRSFLPQLKGEKGNPRDWIYCWYNRGGGPSGREFARNRKYKLYRTGKLYDIDADVLEKRPLSDDGLDEKAKAVKKTLQEALDKYKDARPERLRTGGGKRKQKKNKK